MIKKILSNILLIFLMIILILVVYSKYIRKEKVISLGGYSIFIVLTESMQPTIKEGELIIVKKCDDYKVDDIITYMDFDERLITHRIKQIDEKKFITQGDNNSVDDGYKSTEAIQGKVIYHSKALGIFIMIWMKVLIILILLMLAAIHVRKMLINKECENEEKQNCDDNYMSNNNDN